MVYVLALLLFLPACLPKGQLVEQVGEYEIRRPDIELRDQVNRIYYPTYAQSAGHKQLKEAFQQALVLKKHGRPITLEILEAEAQRIDKESLMPEMLAQIKAVYKKDHQAYLKGFVLPVYVQRTLYYDFFLKNPEFHREIRQKAEAVIARLKQNPEKMKKVAEQETLTVVELAYTKTDGLGPRRAKAPLPSPEMPPASVQDQFKAQQAETLSREALQWEEIFKTLKPGAVYPDPIDQGSSYLVLRYVGLDPKDASVRLCQVIVLPKRDFNGWLEQEVKTLSHPKG